MQYENLIEVEDICANHKIDSSFVHVLSEMGLMEIVKAKGGCFIDQDKLALLEKYIEFHYELDINLEGIETITHLLKQIEGLQKESKTFKNRLNFYEARMKKSIEKVSITI